MFYLINVRSIKGSTLNLAALTGNRVALAAIATVVAGQILFTYAPWLQNLFATEGISLAHWGVILLVGIAAYLLVEAEKACVRWYEARGK